MNELLRSKHLIFDENGNFMGERRPKKSSSNIDEGLEKRSSGEQLRKPQPHRIHYPSHMCPRVYARLTEEKKAAIIEKAKQDSISINALLEQIIDEWLASQ